VRGDARHNPSSEGHSACLLGPSEPLCLLEHYGNELAALLHQGPQFEHAQARLGQIIRDLIAEGANTGEFRTDVRADELASYCLHALTGAAGLPPKAAALRLVAVTLAGLRPPR
jgi:Transcriptional regulator SbtR-like, C-terminal domain